MKEKTSRLFFIDAMRAWAILMMLQGHFIDGLLDPIFRNPDNPIYTTWLYFRGITAPVFFTVSGFIFTYLLIRVPQQGLENPRVKKGIRRGLQLLLIGYLLRLNLFGLLKGEIYEGFYLVDVLQCIGLSILAIIGIYLLAIKRKRFVFPLSLLMVTVVLFLFEPLYKQFTFGFLPDGLANYFTKANGSVFTIFPWLGYSTLGAALALFFTRFRNLKHLYPIAIGFSVLLGYALVYHSSNLFFNLYASTGIELFRMIESNNYLFIRLGDVFLVFAIFMVFRSLLTHSTILKIGSSTLTIYVMHFILLYGSFTGLGLYKFFHHGLPAVIAIPGAVAFMILCTYLSLQYEKHEEEIKLTLVSTVQQIKNGLEFLQKMAFAALKEIIVRVRPLLDRVLRVVRSGQ
ncbi:acyltransferase family protein [Flagellimonas meishanensis]|uniref:acyltransferase family protein n=1 Tax=Flagellimonas meishanensis TaxID=2873264 RepID=UPI001CA61F58|nr:acyltransferase family protein [[Muricauda] meishanensis]